MDKIYLLQFSTGEVKEKFDTHINFTGASAYSSEYKAKRCAESQAFARAGIQWEADPAQRMQGLIGAYQDDFTGAMQLCRIIELEVDAHYIPLMLKDLDRDIL